MATIRAFRAVRPKKGMEERIAALPYDVYNRKEAAAIVKDNPDSFLAIDRAETSFSDDVDTYADEVYEKARELYEEKKASGDFIMDEKPCFYLYELVMDGHKQTGIVGCASVDDYLSGVIKKHENTRADKEKDRIRHVGSLSAQTGPIFLAHRRDEELEGIKDKIRTEEKPVYDFVSDDGITHRAWIIEDDAVNEAIASRFAAAEGIYIADGHHRCASAVRVSQKRREENPAYTGDEEFNFFLSVLFSEDELRIFDYNRVVKDLAGLGSDEFFELISKSFDVSEYTGRTGKDKKAYRPDSKGCFGMYLDGKWYTLRIHEDKKSDDPVKGLDVSLLQDNLLGPVLGIKDPRTDARIDFIGGIRGLSEIERRCSLDCRVGFSMYPTSMTELFSVADAQLLMPPKSTWFEPKLRSGIFIHEI
ncbi:MAG: DUF1015 domain-containing protein [Lachnospiraceae bacterium]|nr:DUF1015 domain-containing protein [Lachnospiraceae bacterium]